ncbi:MAG TPA: hypothetical protein DCZ71_04630 [Ruminococcus sp.]|nr:hypothetical protein [Ruminococcus sp.]
MELSEIKSKLDTIGVPVAYMMFSKPQKLPFIVYYESGTDIRGADTLDLLRETEITVEMYSDRKLPAIERQIESLFADREIKKSADVYLSEEKMLMTAFSFDTIIKTGGNENVTYTD